jgi:hypothetical protein
MKTFKRVLTESEETDMQLKKVGLKRTNNFNKIGKECKGGDIYCHKLYEDQFPADVMAAAKAKLPPDFVYDIVKFNRLTNTVSFMVSSDWDTEPEPSLDGGYTVKQDAPAKPFKGAGWIYHHKWQFVADDYTGFDVEESKKRSLAWYTIEGVDKNRIGQRAFWNANVVPLINKVQEQIMKSFSSLLREEFEEFESKFKPSPTQAELNAMGVKSEATQIETTISAKLKPSLTAEELADGLEYGAGLCHGAQLLGLESFEPYPQSEVVPTYTDITEIKKKYKLVTCTYVLNVVGYDQRDIIIANIGRLLKPGGRAVIVVRGEEDVKGIKLRLVSYGDAEFITKKGKLLTYQKGFTYSELAGLCSSILGSGFIFTKFSGSNGKSVRIQIIKDSEN